jgi:hypothetical protein
MELKSLRSWNLSDLNRAYLVYAEQLAECQRLALVFKFEMPLQVEIRRLNIMPLDRALVVSKLFLDVRRVHTHLLVLEREIGRRTRLVGFM